MKKEILEQINEAKTSKRLSLYNTQITVDLWTEIVKLTHLEELYLNGCSITEIPESIKILEKLERLQFRTCHFEKFPVAITLIPNIKHLEISQISDIPDDIKNLEHLVSLDISRSKLDKLSKTISFLDMLVSLDISDTEIIDFSSLPEIKNLKELKLGRNKLKEIPKEVFTLQKLQKLNIWYNEIEIIPNDISKLLELKELNISHNKINEFPNVLFELPDIEEIDLSGNKIESIPTDLSIFKKLRYLDFGDNIIKEIPDGFVLPSKIWRMRLRRNLIVEPPISILKNLDRINIESNPLNALKFGYIIKDYEHYYQFKFHRLRFNKEEADIFNFNKLSYDISFGDDFIFFKNKDNHGFIQLFQHPGEFEMSREFHKREFYESLRYGAGFLIYILGNIETQKDFLAKIRTHIDNWIKLQEEIKATIYKMIEDDHSNFSKSRSNQIQEFVEKHHTKISIREIERIIDNLKQNKYEKDKRKYNENYTFRFFYYPLSEKFDRDTIIDYDKLLKLKEAKENVYFDDDFGKKLPIIDLLKYIGAENVKIEKKWKGTNYITNAKIQNFKIFKNIEIPFSKNINILLGNNGLGKTSLLQAITFGLLPTENNDYPDNLNEFININSEKSNLIINWGENENRKLYIFSQGKPAEEEPITPPSQLLLSYGVNFNTNQEQDHTKIVNELVDGDSELYFTKSIFEDNYRNLYDPLIILKYLDDKIIASKGLNKDSIKERVLKEYGKTIITDKSISKQISKVTTEIVFINQLILNTLNEYLSLVKKSEQIQIVFHEKEQRYYFTDFFNNKLELQQLSEGYKDHVLLITDILVRIISAREKLLHKERNITINKELFKKINAVVLIDEFDRHLHPSWQRKLLSKFKNDFPNIQFILTTHNPMSILDRDANEIIELKTDETGNIIPFIHAEGTKYIDISKIYLKYFVKDIVSKELHDDIEKYN